MHLMLRLDDGDWRTDKGNVDGLDSGADTASVGRDHGYETRRLDIVWKRDEVGDLYVGGPGRRLQMFCAESVWIHIFVKHHAA